MADELIKDFYGKIIGRIRTDNQGNKIAYDFYGKKLGEYKKQYDKTLDFYGKIYARGDALVSLIMNANK